MPEFYAKHKFSKGFIRLLTGDSYENVMLRKILLQTLCKLKFEPCIKLSKEIFEEAKKTSKNGKL